MSFFHFALHSASDSASIHALYIQQVLSPPPQELPASMKRSLELQNLKHHLDIDTYFMRERRKIPDSAGVREARHRRLEMRRRKMSLIDPTAGCSDEPDPHSSTSNLVELVGKDEGTSSLFIRGESANPSGGGLAHGQVAMMGRMRVMEDAVAVVAPPQRLSGEYSFFAVYDGHGGANVAEMCSKRLHKCLEENIEKCKDQKKDTDWEKVMAECFRCMDEEIGSDESKDKAAERMMGTTAVVVLVGTEEVVVANCGDSRAVLCRGGLPVPLSTDHKADRPDEKERVEAAGGMILNWNGWRVQGILATSRSLGDHYLKPYITSEPEVTVARRTESDEFLIIATDGLWDVVSNETVCEIAGKCLTGRLRRRNRQPSEESRASVAASTLAELAMARGSRDNISIIVVQFVK